MQQLRISSPVKLAAEVLHYSQNVLAYENCEEFAVFLLHREYDV